MHFAARDSNDAGGSCVAPRRWIPNWCLPTRDDENRLDVLAAMTRMAVDRLPPGRIDR